MSILHYRATALTAAFIAALGLAPGAAAQEAGQPPPAEPRFGTQIVVTPERGEVPRGLVPATTVVLDRAALSQVPMVHPSEVTSFLPGFFASRYAFFSGRPVFSARGFFGGGEAEYVLLLVDGVPSADVESGLIDWSAIALSGIQRVEAARGPGASLYGDSAIGGVVQVFTNRTATGGTGSMSGGSFNTFNADGMYGRRAATNGYTMSGAARRTDGAFEHSAARETVGAFAADGQVNRFAWRWNLAADDRMREDPGALTRDALEADPQASDALHQFDRTERTGVTTALTLRHDSLLKPQARVRLAWRQDDLIRTILLAPGFGDRRARDLSGLTFGASLEGERALFAAQPILMRFGVDLARERLEILYRDVDESGAIGDLSGDASGRRLRTGVFVSSLIDVSPRVRVSAGLRWDAVDDGQFVTSDAAPENQRAWSPRAGVVVRISEAHDISLYGQVSRAFKAPTLDQRFDPRPYPDFAGGTFTISNPSLTPQRATNVEAGASGGGVVRWSALAYQMAVEDEIDFDVRTFSYANIGESRHSGIELDAEGRWWPRVRPSVTYALARVVAAGSNRQLKNVPRHVVRLSAAMALPGAVNTHLRYSHASGAFLDDEGVLPLKGVSAVDLRITRTVGRYSLFVDALNLGNDRYEDYGFTLVDFAGATVPYAYPGAPRAVRGGVTVDF